MKEFRWPQPKELKTQLSDLLLKVDQIDENQLVVYDTVDSIYIGVSDIQEQDKKYVFKKEHKLYQSFQQENHIFGFNKKLAPTLTSSGAYSRIKVMDVERKNMEIFIWPEKQEYKPKLKDVLEGKVDEKYYLSQEKLESISKWNAQQDPFKNMIKSDNNQYFGTLTTRDGDEQSGMKLVMDKEPITNIFTSGHHGGKVNDPENVAPTFKENHGNGLFIKEATKKGFAEAKDGDGVYINRPHQKRGVVQKDMIQTIKTQPDVGVVINQQGAVLKFNGKEDGKVATIENTKLVRDTAKRVYKGWHPTIQTKDAGDNILENETLRIRKITPRESLRLMGLDDKRIDLIQESGLISHNKQYFIAGNSIVVSVLEAIFKNIDFPKDRPLKVLETFSGYGSQTVALENLGYEIDGDISEWFIDAIVAYALLHHNDDFYRLYNSYKNNESLDKETLLKKLSKWTLSTDSKKPNNLKRKTEDELKVILAAQNVSNNKGSILDIKGKDLRQYDLLTYSFPCQDLSLAGKGKGMSKGDNTRSGLLWEVERILEELNEENKLPKVLLMENVPQVHGSAHIGDFNKWQSKLNDLGYKNTWRDLNSKDFGVPQNRNRTFMVSILDGKVEDESTLQLELDLF